MAMTESEADRYFQYHIEGTLRSELEEMRRLNVKLSKALLDTVTELKRTKKKLSDLEAKIAQQDMDV
jgi:hypothetical protein